jgi:hypothetical protein
MFFAPPRPYQSGIGVLFRTIVACVSATSDAMRLREQVPSFHYRERYKQHRGNGVAQQAMVNAGATRR